MELRPDFSAVAIVRDTTSAYCLDYRMCRGLTCKLSFPILFLSDGTTCCVGT